MSPVARARGSDAEFDVALARRVADQHDHEAFAAVYDRHAAAAYGVARRILRDTSLAEDVVQEVFIGFWTTPERFDPDRGTLRAWLVTMAHHRSVDAVRRAVTRAAVSLDGIDEPGPAAEDAQDAALRLADADRVRQALAMLPAEQRQTLLLAYWGGHTQAEIADITGVPIGTVKSRVFNAFRRLRGQLSRTGQDAAR